MRPDAALCRELLSDRRSDGELLAAFTSGPSEDAFAELVRRHGPLVWGACRRLLPNHSDAEDAFQAAFLVLVRRARRLTNYQTVAPWLHRVAVWTARNVRRKNARRLARFTAIPEHVPDAPPPDVDLKADLDAALLALPARYRDPILLCHLQGFTRREAAERLGCAEGTLSAWLSRGLEKLRHRLRGLDPSKALSVAAVSVPAVLASNTAHAAVATLVAAASIPPTVSVLVEGVLHMLWMKKATAATFALCAVFAMGLGAGLGVRTESSGAAQDNTPGTSPKFEPQPLTPFEEQEFTRLQAELEIATERYEAALRSANTAAAASLPDAAARFRKDADYAAAEIKVLTEKLDRLKATAAVAQDGKRKVPADLMITRDTDEATRIAIVEERIRHAEKKRDLQREYLELYKKKAELARKTDPGGQLSPADKAVIARAEAELAELEVELKTLQDILAKAKASAKPPASPAGNSADIDKRLLDLKRQLDALREQKQRIDELKKSADVKAAELEEMLRKLTAEAGALELQRAERAGRPGTTAKSAYLEVIAYEKDAKWPYRVREFGADGRLIGSLIVEDPAILSRLFTRAAKDTNGPKEARILFQRGTPTEHVRAVLDACRSAGFQKIMVHEPQSTGVEAIDPMKKPKLAPKTFKDKAELEEYLNKLQKEGAKP